MSLPNNNQNVFGSFGKIIGGVFKKPSSNQGKASFDTSEKRIYSFKKPVAKNQDKLFPNKEYTRKELERKVQKMYSKKIRPKERVEITRRIFDIVDHKKRKLYGSSWESSRISKKDFNDAISYLHKKAGKDAILRHAPHKEKEDIRKDRLYWKEMLKPAEPSFREKRKAGYASNLLQGIFKRSDSQAKILRMPQKTDETQEEENKSNFSDERRQKAA